MVFSPALQSLTWKTVSRLVDSDSGLRRMLHALSRTPMDDWWHTWSVEDKRRARELFSTMRCGSGFVNDLQQARRDRALYRRLVQTRITCPTLVTASRHDAGVAFAHAEDYADTIPGPCSSNCQRPATCSGSDRHAKKSNQPSVPSWHPLPKHHL